MGFALHFVVGDDVLVERHELSANALDEAKLAAAFRYAGAALEDGTVPTAYIIISPTGEVAYRYPEKIPSF